MPGKKMTQQLYATGGREWWDTTNCAVSWGQKLRRVPLAFASPYQAYFRMHHTLILRMGQVVSKHSDAVAT